MPTHWGSPVAAPWCTPWGQQTTPPPIWVGGPLALAPMWHRSCPRAFAIKNPLTLVCARAHWVLLAASPIRCKRPQMPQKSTAALSGMPPKNQECIIVGDKVQACHSMLSHSLSPYDSSLKSQQSNLLLDLARQVTCKVVIFYDAMGHHVRILCAILRVYHLK